MDMGRERCNGRDSVDLDGNEENDDWCWRDCSEWDKKDIGLEGTAWSCRKMGREAICGKERGSQEG